MPATMLLMVMSAVIPPLAPASEPRSDTTLELGVAPVLPARTIVQNYQPMRVYLEQTLKRPVLFVTASSYKNFHERTQRHEYPVIITIASAAYLAATESGYVPMLRPAINTRPVLVVTKDSPMARVQDLRGKTIALPDPLAVISMQAVQILREAEVDPDKDIGLQHLPNHSAAVNHVLTGEVAAAIVSDRTLQQMPPATQQGVRVIKRWEKAAAPGVVYLASPALPHQQVEQMTRTILTFVQETPEGRALMKNWGYGGLVPATMQDLLPLAPYGERFRQVLETMKAEPHLDEAAPDQ